MREKKTDLELGPERVCTRRRRLLVISCVVLIVLVHQRCTPCSSIFNLPGAEQLEFWACVCVCVRLSLSLYIYTNISTLHMYICIHTKTCTCTYRYTCVHCAPSIPRSLSRLLPPSLTRAFHQLVAPSNPPTQSACLQPQYHLTSTDILTGSVGSNWGFLKRSLTEK